MKRVCALAWFTAAAIAGCAAPAAPPAPVQPVEARLPQAPKAPPGPVALRNPGFELEQPASARCAVGWDCTVHASPGSFRFFQEGAAKQRSYCVEPAQGKKKEPWALVTQGLIRPELRGTRVRFSIALVLTGVTGEGAGPWAQAQRAAAGPKPTSSKLMRQAGEWERHSIELDVPSDAVSLEVGLMLVGAGRACFGDARLEVLQ